MAGRFEIYTDNTGKCRLVETARARSSPPVRYESKAVAKNGIESVRTNAVVASVVDLTGA